MEEKENPYGAAKATQNKPVKDKQQAPDMLAGAGRAVLFMAGGGSQDVDDTHRTELGLRPTVVLNLSSDG